MCSKMLQYFIYVNIGSSVEGNTLQLETILIIERKQGGNIYYEKKTSFSVFINFNCCGD